MKKKSLLLTTIASSLIFAGMSMPAIKAATVDNASALIREDSSKVFVQLQNGKNQLSNEELKKLVEERYSLKGSTVSAEVVGNIGTGSVVKVQGKQDLVLVLYGDVNSDGIIDSDDAQAIADYKTNKITLSDAAKLAADVADSDEIDSDDAQRVADYKTTVAKSLLDSNKSFDEVIYDSNIFTVHFVNKKDETKNQDVKTDKNGKISEIIKLDNIVDEEKDVELTFCGWARTENATKKDVIDLSNEVITEDTTLYAVYVNAIKAIVEFHYDGQNTIGNKGVITIPDKYSAGDTINLNDLSIATPSHTSTNGVKYVCSGWYAEGDKEQRELTTYTIPVNENAKRGTVVTIKLHPAWNIEADENVTIDNETKLNNVINELTTLQTTKRGICGNIDINSEITIANSVSIPEGLTLNFEKDVTVDPNGEITGKGKIETSPDVSILKNVDKTVVDDETKGLNASLNNKMYDKVQLSGSGDISVTGDITISEDSSSVLDLNGHYLTLGDNNKIKIKAKDTKNNKAEGHLTIINSNAKSKTLTINNAIENNGTLTIGESNSEETATNTLKILSKSSSTTAAIENGENATLTIKSGIIEGASTAITNGAKGVITNEKGGTVNIEGGKIDASSKVGKMPALLNEGTATISGGEIIRSDNDSTVGNGYYVVVNHGGNMTITGGTFAENGLDSKSKTVLTATSALIENGYGNSESAMSTDGKLMTSELTIKGGSFSGGRYVVASDYAGVTTVTGGIFTAKPDTDTKKDDNMTRSIFKVVGTLDIDLSGATAEDTKIDLGNSSKSETKLVLVGDQYLTVKQSASNSVLKNSLTVKSLGKDLIYHNGKVIDEEQVDSKIKVEDAKVDSDSTGLVKSEIIIYVDGESDEAAGQNLIRLMKDFVAREMKGASTNNVVKIVLDHDVKITASQDTDPGYKLSAENSTLDLNGKTLSIESLYNFNKNISVVDGSDSKDGKIVLKSEKTENVDTVIFSNNAYQLTDEQLAELADETIK